MAKKARAVALAMAVIILLGLLCAHVPVAAGLHHSCSGEGCPVCMQIEQAIHLTSKVKILPMLPFVMAVLISFIGVFKAFNHITAIWPTPVALKVKLNN